MIDLDEIGSELEAEGYERARPAVGGVSGAPIPKSGGLIDLDEIGSELEADGYEPGISAPSGPKDTPAAKASREKIAAETRGPIGRRYDAIQTAVGHPLDALWDAARGVAPAARAAVGAAGSALRTAGGGMARGKEAQAIAGAAAAGAIESLHPLDTLYRTVSEAGGRMGAAKAAQAQSGSAPFPITGEDVAAGAKAFFNPSYAPPDMGGGGINIGPAPAPSGRLTPQMLARAHGQPPNAINDAVDAVGRSMRRIGRAAAERSLEGMAAKATPEIGLPGGWKIGGMNPAFVNPPDDQPNRAEALAGEILSFLSPAALLTMETGKLAVNGVTRKIVTKAMQKAGYAAEAAQAAIDGWLKRTVPKALTGAAQGGAALASYSGAQEVLRQKAEPSGDLNFHDIGAAAFHSFLLGTGAQLAKPIGGLLGKAHPLAGKAGEIGAEITAFAGGAAALEGRSPTKDDFIDAAAMILGPKIALGAARAMAGGMGMGEGKRTEGAERTDGTKGLEDTSDLPMLPPSMPSFPPELIELMTRRRDRKQMARENFEAREDLPEIASAGPEDVTNGRPMLRRPGLDKPGMLSEQRAEPPPMMTGEPMMRETRPLFENTPYENLPEDIKAEMTRRGFSAPPDWEKVEPPARRGALNGPGMLSGVKRSQGAEPGGPAREGGETAYGKEETPQAGVLNEENPSVQSGQTAGPAGERTTSEAGPAVPGDVYQGDIQGAPAPGSNYERAREAIRGGTDATDVGLESELGIGRGEAQKILGEMEKRGEIGAYDPETGKREWFGEEDGATLAGEATGGTPKPGFRMGSSGDIESAARDVAPEAGKAEKSKAETRLQKLTAAEDETRAQIAAMRKKRGRTLGAGLPTEEIELYAKMGAIKLAKGLVKFSEWSRAMLADFGEDIRRHLSTIYGRAQAIHSNAQNADTAQEKRERAKARREQNLADQNLTPEEKRARFEALKSKNAGGSSSAAAEAGPSHEGAKTQSGKDEEIQRRREQRAAESGKRGEKLREDLKREQAKEEESSHKDTKVQSSEGYTPEQAAARRERAKAGRPEAEGTRGAPEDRGLANEPREASGERPAQKPVGFNPGMTTDAEPPKGFKPSGNNPINPEGVVKRLADALDRKFGIRRYDVEKKGPQYFEPKNEVARLRRQGDIAIAADATGDAIRIIDQNKRGIEAPQWEGEIPEAARLELGYLDPAPQDGKRSAVRGFRRLVRQYVTGEPANLEAQRPEAWKWFKKEFLDADPELARGLAEAREMTKEWRAQGAVARAEAMIDWESRMGSKTAKERLQRLRERAVTLWTDQIAPFETARREMMASSIGPHDGPYFDQTARMVSQTSGTLAEVWAYHGMTDFAGNRTGKALKEILAMVPEGEQRRALVYAYGKRALELLSRERPVDPGISLADAEHIVKTLGNEKFEAFSKDLTEWNRGLLRYLADAGGISEEALGAMMLKNEAYFPLFRAIAEDANLRAKGGPENLKGDIIHKIMGSGRTVQDPIKAMITYSQKIIATADRTRIARDMADMAEKRGGFGKWIEEIPAEQVMKSLPLKAIKEQIEAAGGDLSGASLDSLISIYGNSQAIPGIGNTISLVKDGKTRFYELHPDLFRGLQDLDVTQIHPIIDALGAKPARAAKLGMTGLNPGFSVLTNPIRDFSDFVMNTPFGMAQALPAYGRAWARVFGMGGEGSEQLKELYRARVGIGGFQGNDRRSIEIATRKVMGDSGKKKALRIIDPRNWADFLREGLSYSEEVPRLAELEMQLKAMGWKPGGKITNEMATRAALAAKDITLNFSRAGAWGKMVNATVPFFNANVQGTAKFGRTWQEAPLRTLTRGLGLMTLPALANWWSHKDDEEWQNLPGWLKYGFVNFKVFDQWIRVPLPPAWGYTFAALPTMMAEAIYKKDPKAFAPSFGQAMETFLPPVMPATLAPALEVAANKSFYSGAPVVPRAQEDVIKSEQALPSTSATTKDVAKILSSGGVEVSPIQVDHLLRGYTGGLANELINIADRATGRYTGKEMREPADMPVVGRMFIRDGTTALVDNFYTELTKLEQSDETFRKLKKDGNFERAEKYRVIPNELTRMRAASKRLKAINAQIRDEGIDRETRKELYERRNRIIEGALER